MHNYNLLLLFLFLLFDLTVTFGQNNKLSGVVLENNEVLAGATVILKLPQDSIISATITNSQGEFVIEDIRQGLYIISASFLGLKSIEQTIEITGNSSVRLILKENDSFALNEVVVEADRSRNIESTPDGTIFFLSAKAKNAKDIYNALSEIPKLTVDINNRSISLIDGSSPLILVNGAYRESASLSTVDPKNIESVEVLENAKAKYLANGTSSVINIKIKKNNGQSKYVNIGTKQNPQVIYGYSDLSTTLMNEKYSIYLNGQHYYFYFNRLK